LKIENIRKQLETSQNILKILSTIENDKINIWYKSIYGFSFFLQWYSKDLRKTLSLKKLAHKKFKLSPNAHSYKDFFLICARFKYESKKAYRDFVNKVKHH